MIIEKFFDIISKFHHYKIASYVKKLNCNNLIDIGCHKGEFLTSLINTNKFNQFYCFEPQQKIFRILIKKFNKNKKVKLFNFALGDCLRKKKFYISNLTQTSTMSKFDKKSNYLKIKNYLIGNNYKKEKTLLVQQKTLDHVFKNISLNKSFVKIDVEGYEINVLKGSKNKIKEVPFILIEKQIFNQYKNNFDLVNNFLINNNFVVNKIFYFPTLHYQDIIYKNKNPRNFRSKGFNFV